MWVRVPPRARADRGGILRILAVVLALAILGHPGRPAVGAELPPGGTFLDDDGDLHEGDVEAVAAVGITRGCDPLGIRFCPGEPVARAEAAVFVLRAIGHDDHPAPYRGIFSDVPEGAWYASHVEHLADHRITRGCGGAAYCPGEILTRAQTASLLVRALGLPPGSSDAFADDGGSLHEADIDALAAAEITGGCGPDRFCPDQPVGRAQMASLLARARGLDPVIPPPWRGEVRKIDETLRARMPHSWEPECPVPLEDLRHLTVHHWGFDGSVRTGELVVHRDHAGAVLGVLRTLFALRYPIERLELVDVYGGDDLASMEANNSSAFNCRDVVGRPGVWSQHAYGWAVDLNPVQNPFVMGDGTILPEAGVPYADRSREHPAMIRAGDPVVEAFRSIGWGWGGYWQSSKDYMHFSATGR